MAIANSAQFKLLDFSGDDGASLFHLPDGTVTLSALDGLLTAYSGASNCAVTEISIRIKGANADTPSNDMYKAVEDKAVLMFRSTDNGKTMNITIAAPIVDMFSDTDPDAVDPLKASSAAVIAAVIATCVTSGNSGNLIFVKGWRIKT